MTELFIVSTPIGNLKDISQRAIETIKESDVVICENPQHSLKLLIVGIRSFLKHVSKSLFV